MMKKQHLLGCVAMVVGIVLFVCFGGSIASIASAPRLDARAPTAVPPSFHFVQRAVVESAARARTRSFAVRPVEKSSLSNGTAPSADPSSPSVDDQLQADFAETDVDGDGLVSFDEFAQGTEEFISVDDLHAIFDVADTDSNGSLTLDEYKHALGSTAFQRAVAAGIVARHDQDGDGSLSYDELANFLASVMKHANQEQNAALNATDPDEAFADKMVANLTEAMIDMFAGFTAAFVALSVDCDMNSLISVDELANLFAQDSGGDMCIAQMLNDAFSGFGGIFAEGEQQSSEAAAETVLFA